MAQAPLDAKQVGWFAARQPGVIGFLEERLLRSAGDVFAVALEASWQLCARFTEEHGVPAKRIGRSLLERAQAAIEVEMMGTTMWGDTCAERQPELCEWVAAFCQDPPTLVTAAERRKLLAVLLSVVYALDEQATGRPVP